MLLRIFSFLLLTLLCEGYTNTSLKVGLISNIRTVSTNRGLSKSTHHVNLPYSSPSSTTSSLLSTISNSVTVNSSSSPSKESRFPDVVFALQGATTSSLISAAFPFLLSIMNPGSLRLDYFAPATIYHVVGHCATAISSASLVSAAKRNRLDGNTFKGLVLALLCSACLNLKSISSPEFIGLFRTLEFSPDVFSAWISLFGNTMLGYATAKSMALHGWPKLKVKIKGLLSGAYFFAFLYSVFVEPFIARSSNLVALSTSNVIYKASQQLLIPVALHGLHTAAATGKDRLKSKTYINLNAAVILSAMAKSFLLLPFLKAGYTHLAKVLFVGEQIIILTTLTGLWIGCKEVWFDKRFCCKKA